MYVLDEREKNTEELGKSESHEEPTSAKQHNEAGGRKYWLEYRQKEPIFAPSRPFPTEPVKLVEVPDQFLG